MTERGHVVLGDRLSMSPFTTNLRMIKALVLSFGIVLHGTPQSSFGSEVESSVIGQSTSPTPSSCIPDSPQTATDLSRSSDRLTLVHELSQCLETISDRHLDNTSVKTLQNQLEQDLQALQSATVDIEDLEANIKQLEDQEFTTTTKLSGLTVFGPQYGDSVGDRPLIEPLSRDPLPPSRPSAIGITFLSLKTSFNGNDLLQTTVYAANQGQEFFSQARLGNSPSNIGANTFFIPSRTVWSLIPATLSLYRLSYQFQPTSNVTLTVGPKFRPTDIIDQNSFTNPITSFNSWSITNNSLLTPYEIQLSGGAGASIDWNIDGGPFSLKGVYIAREANIAASSSDQGGLFNAPYQGSAELEYRKALSPGKYLSAQLQYSHTDTSGIEQDVLGFNTEIGLGNIGLFGRFGYSWAEADPEVNPLPFNSSNSTDTTDANHFQTLLWQAGIAVKDLGLDRSLLSIGFSQPFRTTLDPAPEIPKRFQTNIEAFYRIPINRNLYLAPTLFTVINPNNRGDQPTLLQGFLRFTVLY